MNSQSCHSITRAAAVLAVALFMLAAPAGAQPSTPAAPAKDAKATGAEGIYLDEPEVIAEPTVVRREVVPPENYPDGKPRLQREVAYYSDNHVEADGGYREFYPNGKVFVEGRFNRGRQQGEWTFYFDNGQVNRKAIYENGQPNGAWDIFRADGTLVAKRSFKNGIRDGEWITYDDTGKKPLREEHYANGMADGMWKVWFPNGKQKQQASFNQGKRHGQSIEWNENGDKLIELNYASDKLEGTATQHLPDGRSIVQQYKDGKMVSQERK